MIFLFILLDIHVYSVCFCSQKLMAPGPNVCGIFVYKLSTSNVTGVALGSVYSEKFAKKSVESLM